MDLSGKSAVYIGGFGGIGYESCKCLLAAGVAKLMIFDVTEDPEKLKALRLSNPKACVLYRQLDLMNTSSIEIAFEDAYAQLGIFEILINGSGIMHEQQIDRTVGINLLGPIYSTFAALRYMDKSQGGNGGVIANISSMVALDAYGGFAVYTATKYGLNGFARALSDPFYYTKTNVGYVTICPSTTETPMLEGLRKNRVTTFPEHPPLPDTLRNNQTAAQCAHKLVEAVKTAKNGSFWMISSGELKEFVYPEMH